MRHTDPQNPKAKSSWMDDRHYNEIERQALMAANASAGSVHNAEATINGIDERLGIDSMMAVREIVKAKTAETAKLWPESMGTNPVLPDAPTVEAALEKGLHAALKEQAPEGKAPEYKAKYDTLMKKAENLGKNSKEILDGAVKAGLDKAQAMLQETLQARGAGHAAALG